MPTDVGQEHGPHRRQWALLEPLFRPKRGEDGRGRPWQDTRAVLNGFLWVLRPCGPRHDLSRNKPPREFLMGKGW